MSADSEQLPPWGGPNAQKNGRSGLIAKAGKPLVKVAALAAPEAPQRLGFLTGEISVPDDFDTMGEAEIANHFGLSA